MSLTVTNLNTLQLLGIVNRTSTNQSNVLTQLSTGYKINKASDNPAGLIAMENFNAELTAVNAALDNNQRADAMLATAEGGLNEVSSLLSDIETLTLASVNDSTLSQAEIAANQSQIDNALEAIDRIVNTTTFNGKQLLNGAQAIHVTNTTANAFENLRVYSRGQSTSDITITAKVATAAAAASGAVTMATAAALGSATTIAVTGTLGTATVTLAKNDTAANIITKINATTASTGVTAVDIGSATNDNFYLKTSGTGSDEYVSMTVLSGGQLLTGAGTLGDLTRQEGTDAVVTINGTDVTADGSDVTYSANGMSFSFSLGTSLDAPADGSQTFTLKASGGMSFQLGVDSSTTNTIGIDNMATYRLGGGDAGATLQELKSGGAADLSQKTANSLKAVRKAIEQVAAAKGRIGGFQKFQVQTSVNSLTAMKEAVTAAKSVIADTDYAAATAELNRQSVLLNSGISLLGLANQQASQILSLLG